jgi:DNA polymerase III sliding clamp (beta) subunit (PCNA family)
MIMIDRNKLKAAARFAACDPKDARLSLHGVLVEASPAGVRLVATDGHVMLVQRAAGEPDTDTWAGIVPADAIKAALAWKGNKTLPIWLTPGEPECRLTRATTGEAVVFVPAAGPFPDYRKVIPKAPSGEASFYDPDLLARFKRAAEDLGSNLGLFDLRQGGDGSGLVYISDDAVGVIMPMRSGGLDVGFCQWAAA